MADGDLFGFDEHDSRRIADAVSFVEHNPRYQLKKRRYPVAVSSAGASSSGGGTGGGGCSDCCDCTSCIDLCTQALDSVVTDCTGCPDGAPKTLPVYFGSVIGTQNHVYTGADCKWTATFSVTYTYPGSAEATGTYKSTLIEAGTASTCDIAFVSGTDCMKLNGGRVLSWKADPNLQWSCTCNNKMIPAVKTSKFPPNLFMPCNICITPADDSVSGSGAICTSYAGCWSPVSFVGMTAVDYAPCDGIATSACILNLDTVVPTQLSPGSGHVCELNNGSAVGTIINYCDNGAGTTRTIVYISVYSASGMIGVVGVAATLYVQVQKDFGVGTANSIYEALYDVASTALGTNTFTLTSSSGTSSTSGAIPAGNFSFPASIGITMSDCTFGATHTDYGYGCGASSMGGPDCGGFGCSYTAYDSTGTQGGAVGPWTWGGCSPSPCPSGCSLPPPPSAAPTGPTDSFPVSCA